MLVPSKMALFLYIHFPRLQLDSLYNHSEASATVIIDKQKNSIVQLNEVALNEGLRQGMGMGAAASLCQHLQIHPYQDGIEKEKLEEIAHGLYAVTADIVLFEPNGLLLDMSKMFTLYGGLENYWHVLKQHLDSLSLHYSYAAAYNPLAAQLLAQNHSNQIIENIEAHNQQLSSLPLSATSLTSKTVDKLKRIGVNDINALLNIPLTELAKRFDIHLVNYVGKLSGQFKHQLTSYQPPTQFKRRLELIYDIEQIRKLERPLLILLNKLEHFLRLRDQVAYQVNIKFHQRDADDSSFVIDSAQGDYKASRWLSLAQLTLESIKVSAPIHSITVSVEQSFDKRPINDDLFMGKKGQYSPLELISTLQAKLGKQAVMGIYLSEDSRPEYATQLCEPLAQYSVPSQVTPKLRPSILLPKPQQLVDKVTIMQGPERLSTGWWDGYPVVRDYFVARCQLGRWLWVYRTPENKWFLHGVFS